MARPVADLDRFLAFVADLRRRAPNDRFHKVLTRRLDTLLDERLESAAHERSAPDVNVTPDPGPVDEARGLESTPQPVRPPRPLS